ncbi:MAG: alpha/beta fold hydrolase [Proteobacteria bacterium]|jgi:esterase|nr:alpha/beta fold hydrolase [Pseudomonadota bacterium]
MLNFVEHGEDTDHPPLLILHGLFGSARNWNTIGKLLSIDRKVIAYDLRNHGSSPWYKSNSYLDLANDIANMINQPSDILGHSMGGKAAMVLALKYPHLVNRLIIGDIAPITYSHTQLPLIEVMLRVKPEYVISRKGLAEQMTGISSELRSFLTQSFDLKEKRWRLNLPILKSEMAKIMGFPKVTEEFFKSTLFITGADSEYVLPEHKGKIMKLFPKTKFVKIPGAGHWLHAEKPHAFELAVKTFLNL